MRGGWSVLLAASCLLSSPGNGDLACSPHAKAKYEAAFCRVKQSSYGRALPSLADFRRNSQKMQYLLLRQPAAKLGISLAAPAASSLPKNATITPGQPVESKPSRRSDEPAVSTTCATKVDSIQCGKRTFVRLKNRSNKRISAAALGASNRLLLSPPGGSEDEAVYLLAAYVEYLNKMISIGLAGSTFSYSAFGHTYYEHQRNGTDFVARFRAMFEILKQDKKQIGVSQRRPPRPPVWRECEALDDELIACYSQGMNLVYQAAR